jgi:hypothetical protein
VTFLPWGKRQNIPTKNSELGGTVTWFFPAKQLAQGIAYYLLRYLIYPAKERKQMIFAMVLFEFAGSVQNVFGVKEMIAHLD